jgi:hypothetical protein
MVRDLKTVGTALIDVLLEDEALPTEDGADLLAAYWGARNARKALNRLLSRRDEEDRRNQEGGRG